MGTSEDETKTGRDSKENKAKYAWHAFLWLRSCVRVQFLMRSDMIQIQIQPLAFESRSEEKEEVSFQPDVSLSDFQVICCLGEGQFGTVELVSQRGRGEETAGAL